MIYYISTVEPIPEVDGDMSPWRSMQLCEAIVERGHDVHLIVSSFNHYTKCFRNRAQAKLFEEKYSIQITFMPSVSYYKNVSARRVLNYLLQTIWLIGFFFGKNVRKDSIVITVPAIEHLLLVKFFKFRFSAADYRDLWPYTFEEIKGGWARNFTSGLITSFYLFILRICMHRLNEIWTISEGFKGFLAERLSIDDSNIRVFSHMRKPEMLRLVQENDPSKINVVYAGLISKRSKVVENIAQFLNEQNSDKLKLTVFGQGDDIESIRALERKDDRICFLGFVDRSTLREYYLEADYGLLAYPNSLDFSLTFPNKVWEYMNYGLPILHNSNCAIESSDLGGLGIAFLYNAELQNLELQKRQKVRECFSGMYEQHMCRLIALIDNLE